MHKVFTENGVHDVSISHSRLTVYMALEQTKNRDAMSKGGIIGVTHSD